MEKKTAITRVAPGTDPVVVDFAGRNVFGWKQKIEPRGDGPRRSLQQVLRELHDSEINAGLQTLAFCGFRVWIGDELNGIAAEATLDGNASAWTDDGAIAHWLHETAVRLYPDSDYARACRR